ncbi:hypothetical protein Tco_1450575, partial [Tanacetum coccineum]
EVLRDPTIKLTIKRPDSTTPYTTYSENEYEHLTKAQQISLVVAVSAKEAEEKENIASVKKAIMAEKVNKMVEGEGEKEKQKNDDDINENDDDHHNDDALIRRKKKGSQEIREEEKQTLIPRPPMSHLQNITADMSVSHISVSSSYDDESTRSSIPYIILTDSEAEDATLPVAPALLSLDYVPASPDYTPDFDLDSEPFEVDPQEADLEESYEEDPSEDDSSAEDPMKADGLF